MKIEIDSPAAPSPALRVDPSSLRLHPDLKTSPPPPPELLESMTADIEERGIDQPLIVDENNRVLDGKLRLRIALDLNLTEIAITRRSSAEAATIIVQSLLQRRHYSKLALAYLAIPFFDGLVSEARARQVAGLKHGKEPGVRFSYDGKNKVAVAARLGIGTSTLSEALAIHRIFAANAKAKELFEPKILNGDLAGGKAIVAITGHVTTSGKERIDSAQLDLFEKAFHLTSIRLATRWQTLGGRDRQRVLAQYATEFLPALPPEFHQEYQRYLRSQKAEARS